MDRQEFGRAGEKRAERFLRGQKHRIVARNYRAKQGEVDIISLAPDRTLVFTEVRSKHDCTIVGEGRAAKLEYFPDAF